MNWTALGIVGTLVVSFVTAVFGLYQARKADTSATTTATIELGVRNLVDQYREANDELREDVKKHEGHVRMLEAQVRELRSEVDRLSTIVDDREANIIRLKRELGEL